MKLVFLPANMCWAFFFGDVLTDMGGQRLFLSRQEAVDAAAACGLKVNGKGEVE